jgi:hypothetical protein
MRPAALILGLLLAIVTVARAGFWTSYPPDFDFANFALGVERFSPADHQPHPPGYPLVILTARGFAAVGMSQVSALHATALLGTLLAVLGAYLLGRRVSGERGGVLTACLVAANPVFWHASVSSPTRIYLAAAVCWVLWCLLELVGGRSAFLWIGAGAMGLFAGFRPELLALLAGPLVIASRMAGIGWRRLATAGALSAALCVPWMLWIAASYHSLFRAAYVYYYYVLHHVTTTSVALGAPQGAWTRMLRDGFLWNALAAATVALSVTAGGRRGTPDRAFLLLTCTYAAPALAIQLLLHLGADTPGHAIGTVAALSAIAGGWLGAARAGWVAVPMSAAMLAVTLAPPGVHAALDSVSARSYSARQRVMAAQIEELRNALEPGDAIVVLNDSPVAGRILEWEFPDTEVVAFSAPVHADAHRPAEGMWFFRHRHYALGDEHVFPASTGTIHILSGRGSRQWSALRENLCARFPCGGGEPRLEVHVGPGSGRLRLNPYTLVFARPAR